MICCICDEDMNEGRVHKNKFICENCVCDLNE